MSSIYDKQRSNLIRKYEGFEPEAYRLHGENFNTIGYGSTSYEDGSAVGNQDKISKKQAQELLDFHIERTREPVSTLVGYKKLPPGAQVAVDSFAYNTGPNFIYDDEGFGTINRAIRAGDAKAVADALPLYDNGGLAGLVRRRAEEASAHRGRQGCAGRHHPGRCGRGRRRQRWRRRWQQCRRRIATTRR